MSCADTRATPVERAMRKRAATRAARDTRTALLGRVRPGPDHALVRFRHRPEPLVQEALQALSFPRLGRVDVALRVGRDAVHAVELARLPAAIAEAEIGRASCRERGWMP